MDEQVLQLAEQLLATGFLKLSERERRVITGVAKQRRSAETSTVPLRKSRPLATAWPIAWPHSADLDVHRHMPRRLIAWTAFNSAVRAWQVEPFDPYPYIFLNLILSMLAALQAPIILMSQNRQAGRDRLPRVGLRSN